MMQSSSIDNKYSFVHVGGSFVIKKQGSPLFSAGGNAVVTEFEHLAIRLVNDLNEYGENYLNPASIVSFHYTMLDLIETIPPRTLISSLLAAFDAKNDWTFDSDRFDIEQLPEFHGLFGFLDSNRKAKIEAWIKSLKMRQICAVQVARKYFRSINVLYNLAEIVAASEIGDYIHIYKKMEDFNMVDASSVVDNFFLYYALDLPGHRIVTAGDEILRGKSSYGLPIYNVREFYMRLYREPLFPPNMSALEKAVIIATRAHRGQQDKAGQPYVLHPLRIMVKLDTETEKIVGVLHDVVEDTPVSFNYLIQEGFSQEIISALRLLTHEGDVVYMDYIKEIAENPIALKVKLLDLQDNMDLNRIPDPVEKDFSRLERYREAYQYLTERMQGIIKQK